MLDSLGIHIQYSHAGGKLERPADMKGRLIHLHRDPRDTVTSAWFQHRKRRGDYGGDFSEFLRDSFSRMRALEASGEGAGLYGFALTPGDPADPETYKTREGKIGGWRDHFAVADVEFAERVLNEHAYFERIGNLRA